MTVKKIEEKLLSKTKKIELYDIHIENDLEYGFIKEIQEDMGKHISPDDSLMRHLLLTRLRIAMIRYKRECRKNQNKTEAK